MIRKGVNPDTLPAIVSILLTSSHKVYHIKRWIKPKTNITAGPADSTEGMEKRLMFNENNVSKSVLLLDSFRLKIVTGSHTQSQQVISRVLSHLITVVVHCYSMEIMNINDTGTEC